jgi:propanol-preferring alcohol dehydrogenase
MSDIPSFPYSILWEERKLLSVANLERRDGNDLLAAAAQVPIHTAVEPFALVDANQALSRLREGCLSGAAVLVGSRMA